MEVMLLEPERRQRHWSNALVLILRNGCWISLLAKQVSFLAPESQSWVLRLMPAPFF